MKCTCFCSFMILFFIQSCYCQKNKGRNESRHYDSVFFDLKEYSNWKGKFINPNSKDWLFKIAVYNEAVKKKLPIFAIKPIAVYNRNKDSIVNVDFYKDGRLIHVVNDSLENGVIIKYKKASLYRNEYNVFSGSWSNGLRDGAFLEYYPLEKDCATITV